MREPGSRFYGVNLTSEQEFIATVRISKAEAGPPHS